MSVHKRIICRECRRYTLADKEAKSSPACPSCGGGTYYSENWYVSITLQDAHGRKHKHVESVSPNLRFTKEYEAKLISDRASGKFFGKKKALTFDRAAEEFLKFCRQQVLEGHLSDRTLEMYESQIKWHLLPHFKGVDLLRIAAEDIEEYKQTRMSSTYVAGKTRVGDTQYHGKTEKQTAPATVNRSLATLKRLFSVAVQKRLIEVNPAQSVRLLKEDNRRDRFLTQEEIGRLLDECKSKHLKMAVTIALNTGLRLEGCLGLRWEDVDFQRNELTRKVKGGKSVRIPLTQELRKALLDHRGNVLSIVGYVLPSPSNSRLPIKRGSNFGFETACKKAGLEGGITFHTLRHTFASHFLMRTGDIQTLAGILGHSMVSITERYTHLLDDVKRQRMREFEDGR